LLDYHAEDESFTSAFPIEVIIDFESEVHESITISQNIVVTYEESENELTSR
jgi:hypothetical protein